MFFLKSSLWEPNRILCSQLKMIGHCTTSEIRHSWLIYPMLQGYRFYTLISGNQQFLPERFSSPVLCPVNSSVMFSVASQLFSLYIVSSLYCLALLFHGTACKHPPCNYKGNHNPYLICFSSLKDHYPLFSDALSLENFCFMYFSDFKYFRQESK